MFLIIMRCWSLFLLLPAVAHADAVERLHAFFKNTASMRAEFHQTVLDSQGRKVQEVTGIVQLLRPGRFRWDYRKPYVQIIVGDGRKVWLFDPELNQVTVRSVDQVLGSSPAALLAGSREIDKTFMLKDLGRQEQLEWVEATPRDKDSGFEKVMLGFDGDLLVEMEVHDNFGQTTVIELSKLERNPKLDARAFRFVPPPGADVVGD